MKKCRYTGSPCDSPLLRCEACPTRIDPFGDAALVRGSLSRGRLAFDAPRFGPYVRLKPGAGRHGNVIELGLKGEF